ncbi:cytochrome P450 [Streptomyces hiroshimensis]|uniref:Bifunctional cytochrome P450/NADPH--P450 reductase n=1 Tax=Streptomyces hiroshimensis TaxID=66424 RepID=A0ABQ2YZU0_9ACTN|nr:cytochrome P450 [Streptomyces hiroshimensis]GGY00769.1 NADPH--cytochrome P450 reductase [Streptomyces hiroshimensis]
MDPMEPMRDLPVVDVSDTGLTDRPVQQAMAFAREFGPAFRRRFHSRETVLISSYELVDELSDETRFAKVIGPALENVREVAADGLFTAYNDEPNWAKAHDILLPAFAMGSMRTYHPVMLKAARRMITAWDAYLAQDKPVDVSADMTRMTLDTIGLAGFGYDFQSFDRAEPHPFVQALVRALSHSQAALGRTPGEDTTEEDRAFRADTAYLAQVVDEVIAGRRAAGESGAADDLLGLMLNSPHHGDGEPLDEANVRNQVITFLIAGHETTSGTLSFALYHLMKNPVALRLAQAEVDALWGDDADPQPAFEDIGRLRYVRQVLSETLRLWPTAAAFERAPVADTVIGGRYPVPAGRRLTVLTPMLHRDPVWGDNVEEFDPDRFAPAAEAARPANAYKPFGTGERACIGRQFAMHEATMLLALLIHRYRFLDHTGYALDVKETLTLKPDGFTLALAHRTAEDRDRVREALGGLAGGAVRTDRAEEQPEAGALPSRAAAGTALTVAYGSNFGTCREFAEDLAGTFGDLGFATEAVPLDKIVGALPADAPLVIVAASYNGQPTDDARAFTSWLADAEPGAADAVPYAVLGVGDRNWAATYQHVPTAIDDRLAGLGATRLLERHAADASGDLAGSFARFTAALRRVLLAAYGDPGAAVMGPEDSHVGPENSREASPGHAYDVHVYDAAEITGDPLDAQASRHGLVPMAVTATGDLADPAHPLGRSKKFVRLALPEGVAYRTADHLAVMPANDPALVERAITALGLASDAVLSIRARRIGPSSPTSPSSRSGLHLDRPVTVRELLTHHVELQHPLTTEQVARLAGLNPCPPEQAALRQLATATGPEQPSGARAPRYRLLDLAERYPALRGRIGWPLLLDLLPPMRTRHYSISSSPATGPGHADLMVSQLRAPARSGSGIFEGTGSSYLHRVRSGDTVYARVQPCRDAFRIRHDAQTPVIMVAAGTGLAPFRGAVADRLALARQGTPLAPALCYFGCDHPDVDYLHRAELEAAEEAGAVSMRPVFSKAPEEGRMFVQHRLEAEGAEVWRLLQAGAKVYVCGDGSRMAPGVRDAFQRLHARHTGGDAAAAQEWWRAAVAEGRYVEDVYTSS